MASTNEIAYKLAQEHGLPKAQAKSIVDFVLQDIVSSASQGEEVSLSGSGKFKVKDSPERNGRNPSTGAAIKIASRNKLTFSPAKAVKDALNS